MKITSIGFLGDLKNNVKNRQILVYFSTKNGFKDMQKLKLLYQQLLYLRVLFIHSHSNFYTIS